MSCEVCPFCGKTYKRLKSHLPHCKAAAASKAPPSKLDVSVNQTASSSQLDSVLSTATTKGRKSSSSVITDLQRQTGKRDTASGPANAPSSSPRSSSSLTLLSPTTKKKQKLVDQIKTSTLLLSPSPPLPPTTSKPKKKSLRALIEAAKSDQITKGSLKVSETVPSLSSRTTAQTKTKTNPGKDYALLSADAKPKDAPKKTPKTKKVNQMLSTTKQSESSTKSPEKRHNFWKDSEQEIEDSSMNNLVLKLGNGHQAKITLQDVKATLGRARPPCQSNRPSILSQIQTNDNLCSKIGVDTGVGPVPLLEDNQKNVATQSELLSTSPQHAGLKSDKKISSKTKQLALVPLQDAPESTPPAAPFLPAHVSTQLWQAMPPPVNLNEGLKVSHHMTGLLTKSAPVGQFSSLLSPLVSQSLPVKVETVEKTDVRKQNTPEYPTEGALTHRSLGQVRLRELPKWLACKAPSHPKDAVEMLQRGWQWYYRRYIDVKKGGVGGLGMLLAGYCVLSYIWSYRHIKLDRWRKYH